MTAATGPRGDAVSDRSAAERRAIETARAFVVEHVLPHAAAWERGTGDALEALAAAGRLGLAGLQVPEEHGGSGLSFSCKLRVAEVLAAADFGIAMALVNTHNVADALAREAAPEVARLHVPGLLAGQRIGCTALTEPGAGSDFAAIATLARQEEGHWRLDGRKAWITNANHADVAIVYAQTQPGSGAAGIAAFVVDANRPGFHREPGLDVGAVRSMGTGGFRLEGFVCRAEEMLAPPGQAFKPILNAINGARVYVAAMCCAMVDEALRAAAAFGAQRKTFGRTLHEHQGWRWLLAGAAVDLAAARALVDVAARSVETGADAQSEAAAAKVFATRMAQTHLAALLHALGAEGLSERHPLLRHLAAAQVAGLVDGSTEMLLERVARKLGAS
jgi:alkylation response protein AidB-like acyl-CoA dehydrogenase